ncbi:hypothetical protein ACHAW6_000507 [Cyclotella cf. meneghiniana]
MAEWQYNCRIVPNIGPLLDPIDDALCTKFLPAILDPNIAIVNDLRKLLAFGVKAGGVTIQNPTLIVDLLFCTSQDATSYLSGSLLCNEPMCTHHHCSTIHTTAASNQKEQSNGKDTFLQALLKSLPPKVKKRLERAGLTGAVLTTIPDHFSSTKLTKTEWFDNITLWYGSRLPHLLSCCDGCGKGFTVEHALNCKKVVIKPTILYGNDSNPGACQAVQPTSPPPPTDTLRDESWGDILVNGFWQCARGTIFDICICNTDARSYANNSSDKVLEYASKEKSRSMNRPVSPNVKTSPHSSTRWMDSHPRRPGKPSNALPAFWPSSGTAPTLTP